LDCQYSGWDPVYFEYVGMMNFNSFRTWSSMARIRWRLFCWISVGIYSKDFRAMNLVRGKANGAYCVIPRLQIQCCHRQYLSTSIWSPRQIGGNCPHSLCKTDRKALTWLRCRQGCKWNLTDSYTERAELPPNTTIHRKLRMDTAERFRQRRYSRAKRRRKSILSGLQSRLAFYQ